MQYTIYKFNTIVIGSGAAGFNCANQIKKNGKKQVALITENINFGTSRNTGSDKQTYYKLTLCGNTLDSVAKMAQNLYDNGAVDGDNALCEAALSTKCFFNLADLGVEFPQNNYGEYVGYQTDHDLYKRASSAGPLTSKLMTEALQKQAESLNLKIFNNTYCIKILTKNNKVIGLICWEILKKEFNAFVAQNIVLATGGPAGIYLDSAYPKCHMGSSSLAIRAGAEMQNFCEWQYGLSSIKPRWNVSGSYMQVLPRFVSVDKNGIEYEFLLNYFKNKYDALNMIFLKGYQWPFDCNKLKKGSSIIDILVYRENKIKNRQVFLDFTKNPFNIKKINFEKLNVSVKKYLINANAIQNTPIERLKSLNNPAIKLYKSKGINLYKNYLEIALCAQHNNGGIAVDKWWQTNIGGLFAIGECAGTHGIYRPGGSALNAGQVGAVRASMYINNTNDIKIDSKNISLIINSNISNYSKLIDNVMSNESNVDTLITKVQKEMSKNASAIRNKNNIKTTLTYLTSINKNFKDIVKINSKNEIIKLFQLKDIIISSIALLNSILDYCINIKNSRGSAVYYKNNKNFITNINNIFNFSTHKNYNYKYIQNLILCKDDNSYTWYNIKWRKPREIPKENNIFENIWKQYLLNKNIY